MNKAMKFRIYPNKEQKELLSKTFGCVRFIYNKMLGDKISYYGNTKKNLRINQLNIKTNMNGSKKWTALL